MEKPQYAILRFAKYKGPEISGIEAHNERTKEKYDSNPNVDLSRSHLNYHLVTPDRRYRAEAERQIAAAKCRVRSDSVRLAEALITASPEFFQGKTDQQVRAFFEEALAFLSARQSPETIVSAVVHMDEKTPHMHLTFVPLTADGRLCAKEIVGNKKKLTQWQNEFWEHMVKKFPKLERGESASLTGRTHIPTRLYKEATRLNRQREMLMGLLGEITVFNRKSKTAEIEALLETFIPSVEKMKTSLKKYNAAYRQLKEENAALEKALDNSKESVLKRLETQQQLRELEDLRDLVENIPPEILKLYHERSQDRTYGGNCL